MSLFEGLTIPLSHWSGGDPPSAFDTVKTKGIVPVPDSVRIRIDFKARLTEASASSVVSVALPVGLYWAQRGFDFGNGLLMVAPTLFFVCTKSGAQKPIGQMEGA